ncbi:MAG: hypothetical protein KAT11_05020 [Phycisphaerae bacterium]|nr:hypothetical protein [Phycisphaerae bacterium]
MSLIDIPITEETIADKANKIREKLASVIGIADIRLHEIRNLVRKYGRTNIAAELGDDAAALLTVYTKLKEAIEAAKEITVQDLPD